MTQEPSVYQRRRKASAQELAQIPWLTLLTAQEREFVAPQIVVSDPKTCLLYTSPSPRDGLLSRMPSSA